MNFFFLCCPLSPSWYNSLVPPDVFSVTGRRRRSHGGTLFFSLSLPATFASTHCRQPFSGGRAGLSPCASGRRGGRSTLPRPGQQLAIAQRRLDDRDDVQLH